MDNFFSRDYENARRRFRDAASRCGAQQIALPIESKGPHGEALTIDIAVLGNAEARQWVLHSSGLHGVEGFAGSAIQLAALQAPPVVPSHAALVLVHGLNPYGMAWWRRTNEHNVDLNRNFLAHAGGLPETPAAYRRLDSLLNPRSPPRFDAFLLRALWQIARHGFRPLKQAVAIGQYSLPHGLFYGGQTREAEICRYLDWLTAQAKTVERVLAIDVHTGLGRFGEDILFHETRGVGTDSERLAAGLRRRLTPVHETMTDAYANRGGYGSGLMAALHWAQVDFLTQEFGTFSALTVLRALRAENRWHHWGSAHLDHRSKRRLRAVFCPDAPRWRQAVVQRGVEMLRDACRFGFKT